MADSPRAQRYNPTASPREGEALELTRLARYLTHHAPAYAEGLAQHQYPSGHSNLTYLLETDAGGVVLRRPPRGAEGIRGGHDMYREYRLLSALHPHYNKAPRPILYCDDPEVLGAPFYLMERVDGLILRNAKIPEGIDLPPRRMRAACEALIDNFAALHRLDIDALGLADFGRPQGYIRRQIEGWHRRYQKAQTDDIAAMDRASRWLAANMPQAESDVSLIHNDYKYDNVVLDPDQPDRLLAVLDWEMATIGDPLMDLGTSLSYWIDPDDREEVKMLPFGVTLIPGNLSREEVAEHYLQQTGRSGRDLVFYYVYGLYKVAVIAQQIYYRYKQGYTSDPRFETMIMGVRLLAETADRAITLGRIGRLH